MANAPTEKLIFDRTVADIENRTSKGYYNIRDLQRIQGWVAYLNEQLEIGLVPRDFVFAERMTRKKVQDVLNNITAILAKIYEGHTPPTVPIPIAWNYTKANDVERILWLANTFVEAFKHDTLYANTFMSDEFPVFRGDKPTAVPQKYTVRLVSLSGAIAEYSLNGGSWWRIPEYATVFPNDGYVYNWETDSGDLIIDKGVLAIPITTGISVLTAR